MSEISRIDLMVAAVACGLLARGAVDVDLIGEGIFTDRFEKANYDFAKKCYYIAYQLDCELIEQAD